MGININTSSAVRSNLILCLDAGNPKSYNSGSSNWKDLSGNNYNASFVSNPPYNTNNGGSIIFDGSTQYATTNLTNGEYTQPFSFEIGFNTNLSNNLQFFLSSYNNTSGIEIFIGGSTFEPNNSLAIGFNNSYYKWTTANIFNINTNNIFTITYDGSGYVSNTNFYLNGIQITTFSRSDVTVIGSSILTPLNYSIGARSGITIYRYSGSLFFIKGYNRVLTPSEVFQNYKVYKTRFGYI
jgi:hypothetical protein